MKKHTLKRATAAALMSATLATPAVIGLTAGTANARPIDGIDCNMVMDAWVHSWQSLEAAKAINHQSEIRFWQGEYDRNDRWIRVNC